MFALKILNFLFENITALVAGYTDFTAAFRGALHLLACGAFEVSVVFTVTVQVRTEWAVKISPVPGELGTHFNMVF